MDSLFDYLNSGDASCFSLLPQDGLPLPTALPPAGLWDNGPDTRLNSLSNLSLRISTARGSLDTKRMSRIVVLAPSVKSLNADRKASTNKSRSEVDLPEIAEIQKHR